MNPDEIARDEARMLADLVVAGRRAAALDGWHMLVWGLVAAAVLAVQYAAEVHDWLPSRLLWMWQPFALAGFVASIFLARKGAGRRLGNPVSRAYTSVFVAAGAGLAIYLLVAGAGGVPKGLTTAVLVAGTLAAAFFVLAMTTHLRWMLLPAAGWWSLLAFYAWRGAVVPVDWLRLAIAFLVLLALPGAALIARRTV